MRKLPIIREERELPVPDIKRTPAREALRQCFADCRAAEEAVDQFRKSLTYFSSLLTQLEKSK